MICTFISPGTTLEQLGLFTHHLVKPAAARVRAMLSLAQARRRAVGKGARITRWLKQELKNKPLMALKVGMEVKRS